MKNWVLFTGDRWAVAAAQMAGVMTALVVAGHVATGPGVQSLVAEDPVQTLFQALVAGIVTGVTLVLTVNQLVLSQELGSLSDQWGRLKGAMSYREDVDEFVDPGAGASPAEPAAFLASLVREVGERGRDLADLPGGADLQEERSAIARYGRLVEERARQVAERLDGREFGDFGMLWAALHYDYSRQIQEGRGLLRDAGGETAGDVRSDLEAIVQGLVLFGSAREHFKTLYFQRDLIDLSRGLLALALPALVVAALVLLYFDPSAHPWRLLGVPGAVWILSLAFSIAVAPFVLLLSFILRISTVTRRTLAAGPFVLHPDEGRGGSI